MRWAAIQTTVTVFRRAQIDIEAATFEDSSVLVDGDTYSLTIVARNGSVPGKAPAPAPLADPAPRTCAPFPADSFKSSVPATVASQHERVICALIDCLAIR
jgi:hypothetical protein